MRINEVEQKVGITKKNIRFYEKEGLLNPARSLENGYRDYSDEDVVTLKKIRLLRQLSVPLEEIRRVQSGTITMEGILRRHIIALEEQSGNLAKIQAVCERLVEEKAQYAQLDTDMWLAELEKLEKEGMHFMDVKKLDKRQKKQGSIIAALVFCALMLAVDGLFIWAFLTEPEGAPPLLLMAVFLAIPAVFAVGALLALWQRMKEIEGGEEDAAAKY
ncbi:MAG: MerR family transcriptional regulator [Lachnospiraceae bacterium]|nr:MerR family transcriptional regulator [Lachnospiraceae bacterium]